MKNFKRILATVLAVLFVLSVAVVSVSAVSVAWYKAAVEYLDNLGISSIGSTGGEEVTRDEFVTWVAKIESHQLIESAWKNHEFEAMAAFDDVADSEHKGAIGYSIGREFITGDKPIGEEGNTFRPHDALTFGEASVVIVRLMAYENKVIGETWEEQLYNYLFVANTYCGAFDATFLAKTAQYDPYHTLTKGEAAYILYTIMNGAAWADGALSDQEYDDLRLTAYGVDLGNYFGNNFDAKAQFVVANVPLVYTTASTLRTFARHDAYVTGSTAPSLFADTLFETNGILNKEGTVILQNLATNGYVAMSAADFSSLVKKAAGHSASDDTTDALNYVELGGVVTITVSKANKGLLTGSGEPGASTLTKGAVKKFAINDFNAVDNYVGVKAVALSAIKTGTQALGWKALDAKASGDGSYTRLTSTPVTWTNVKYNGNGVPTSGNLVVNGETYSIVTSYTGKANEIKVFAPAGILTGGTTKTLTSVVGRVGDTVYAGAKFEESQKNILNLHRHVKVSETYYTKSTKDGVDTYTAVDFTKTPYDSTKEYYVATDAKYRKVREADFAHTVNGYEIAEVELVEGQQPDFDATKTYCLKDGDVYILAKLADFDVSFKEGTVYYVYDAQNDKYIKNTEAYSSTTTYYLQNDKTQETTVATASAFTVKLKAGTTYYTATKNPTYKYDTTYYALSDQGVFSVNADAVTRKWVLNTKYYTYDNTTEKFTEVEKDVVTLPDSQTQYYVATSGTDLVYERVDGTTYFDYSKNYYTAAQTTTGEVDPAKIGSVYYTKVNDTTLKLATLADFTIGFKAGVNYYTYDKTTDTYPKVDTAEYDSTKTYYIEKNAEEDDELVIAVAPKDFALTFKANTNYFEVTKVDTATTAYSNNAAYYVDDTTAGQIKKATAADFPSFIDLSFEDGVIYYEKVDGRFVRTTDAKYDITKTYYVDGTYDEFFDGLTVKKTFTIEEYIPSFVTYELDVTGGKFVTNTTFNFVSEFVVDGRLDKNLISTSKALTTAEALQLILGPAQGECNVVFSDTDGDGTYDVAVVTESTRALYYDEINSSTDVAGEGYLGGNASWTRKVYDSFGNYITAVQGLKGHNIGGIVVDKTVGFGGASGNGTDGWNTTSSTPSNKVQLVVCPSNERQYAAWNADTSQYGAKNTFPYGAFDVAALTTGYIETVAAGTSYVGGVEVYTASVIKADGERTTVYIPVNPAEKITLSVTVDGVASDVTLMAGKSLLSFVTDYNAAKQIGEYAKQDGSWMAGHTVKYVAYENGVAWCMVDTAVSGAVKGYVADVTKTDAGDNTYKVTVVASAADTSSSKKFAATAQSVQNVIEYSVTSIQVINGFGIDALFADEGEMTVKAYKITQKAVDLMKFAANGTIGGAYGNTDDFVVFKTVQANQNMTALWYDTADNEPDGVTKPYWVADNFAEIDTTTPTFKGSYIKAGAIISAYDYELYVKDEYKNSEYFVEKEYDAHDLFGYIDWTKLGTLTESSTQSFIGASVKKLDVKGSATAVWTYDAATYKLVNEVLVKGVLYNSNTVENNQIVSPMDLVYLSFTKDAGAYYTIEGLDNVSYNVDVDTGATDWSAITFSTNNFVQNKHTGYRAGGYFGYRFALLQTGAATDGKWTNSTDTTFENAYILGYSKKANSKVETKDSNNTVNGYYELYDMVVGYNPYYLRTINDKGAITYTLYFTTVKTLTNVKGYMYHPINANATLLIALINQSTMKQEVDDGVSYKDTATFYVDPTTKLVYNVYGKPIYDTTKTTSKTPDYVTTGAVAGATASTVKADDIKSRYGLANDITEESLVSLSVAPFTENEAGYVPGLFHVSLTDGFGKVKTFQMTQNTNIAVIHPDAKTGNFEITLTTPKALYESEATVFVTDYQYKGTATTCTMLSVIGKLNKPVSPSTPIDPGTPVSEDTVSAGARVVYLNGDATVIAEAIQLSNYWVIRSTSSAIDVTTGEEVGSIQFVFTTYKEDKITEAQAAIKAGGYFLINSDNDVIGLVDESKAGITGDSSKKTAYAEVLTGIITGTTADGKTTATINGKSTDVSNKTFKFIYHDTEGKNFGIGGSSTSVAILTTSEIEATWAADAAVVAEGANKAPHYYTKEDVDTSVENVAAAKAAAIDAYLNGTFWNVEFSPLYNYFVSQRVSYQTKGEVTLTFNYVVINDVYYVFVNSFTK